MNILLNTKYKNHFYRDDKRELICNVSPITTEYPKTVILHLAGYSEKNRNNIFKKYSDNTNAV